MSVYEVTNKHTKKVRLIETRNQSVALKHCAKDDYEIKTLTTSGLVKILKTGIEVETITPEEEEKTGDILKEADAKKASEDKTEANPTAEKIAEAKKAPEAAKAALASGTTSNATAAK